MVNFEEVFDDFCNTNTGNVNYIKDIKGLFNNLTSQQLQLLHQLQYYGNKWDCKDLLSFCEQYKADCQARGIKQGLFGSNLRTCIKAYSLEEYMKGINGTSVNKNEK